MTVSTVLTALFGAALVALGVLAAALADRIRGLRISRDRVNAAPRAAAPAPARGPIEVVEPPLPPVPAPKPKRQQYVDQVAAGTPPSQAKMELDAREVIAALVATGYKKPIAAEAVWGCGAADRATIELWTRAALRRCAQGGVS